MTRSQIQFLFTVASFRVINSSCVCALFCICVCLLHALGRTFAWFGRAAEAGAVTTHSAGVFEFSFGTLSTTGDRPCASATGACMCANQFGGCVTHQELSALRALLHARDIHGLALGAHHRHAVVRCKRIRLLCGCDGVVKHH